MVFPMGGSYPCGGTAIALTIDSQESGAVGHNKTSGSPLSWTFANTAGTLLIVGATVNTSITTVPSISGVTYGGKTMTAVTAASAAIVGTANSGLIAFFSLTNPPTGSNTVSVSFAGGGGYLDCIAGAISFKGQSNASPVGNVVSAVGNGTTASATIPGTRSKDYMLALVATGTDIDAIASPFAVSWELNVSSITASDNAAMAVSATSAGGSFTPTFTVTTDHWGIVGVEIFHS